jgi:hypothetical protein
VEIAAAIDEGWGNDGLSDLSSMATEQERAGGVDPPTYSDEGTVGLN